MKQLLKIDNIMYLVKDLDKSADFYENVLGLEKRWIDKERGMIGFTFKGSDSEIVITTDKSVPNYSFSFLVDNVEKFCKEYEGMGYKLLREPFDVRPGKFAVLQDLDGNEISIIDLTKFGGEPRYD